MLANRGTMDERCIVGAWRLTIQDDGEARYKERQWSIQHPLQRQKLRHILIHDNMGNLLYFIFVLFINLYIYIYVCMYLHLFIWFLVQYETYEIFRGLRFIYISIYIYLYKKKSYVWLWSVNKFVRCFIKLINTDFI